MNVLLTREDVALAIAELAPKPTRELLDELGEKNVVRVTKFAAGKRVELDEVFAGGVLLAPALVRLDELRALAGEKPRYLEAAFAVAGLDLVDVVENLRTNAGIDFAADSLSATSGRPAAANYIALTENGTAPAAGDTTLTSEITTNGLARAQGTYTHTASATSYTIAKQFTASGTFSTVQKDGIFNAASAGTLFLEATFTAVALIANDQLTVTHTVNI